MSESPLVLVRELDADCDSVFSAWTDPSIVAQWFFVGPDWQAEMVNDLRVGGRYELKMTTSEGQVHTMHGEYLEIQRPRRLSFTWSSHVAKNTEVTIELEPSERGTQLTLTHRLVPADAVEPHAMGWQGCLGHLHELLGVA
jgi:uncharacterized protein YndB with AHSA1/START domain